MRLTNGLLPKAGFKFAFGSKGFLVCGNIAFRTTGALKRLIANEDGVVSFEYVLVAAAIVGAVFATFGTATGNGPINDALISALNTMVNDFKAAVGA
jgi:hypothetical protein